MFAPSGRGERNSTSKSALVHPQPKRRRRRRRDGEEDEPVLRTTCDNCTSAKVKCNGQTPCVRCMNKNISCEYTYKKRCGPKRRKGVPEANAVGVNVRGSASDSEGLLASYSRGGSRRTGEAGILDLESVSVVLGKDEAECVRVFMNNVNSFMPLTTVETVKQAAAMKSSSLASGGDGSQQQHRQNAEEADELRHARKAVLHGAIAVGAEFLDKEEVSQSHAQIARQEIKECFDAAVPELVGAYLILALYWNHQMDSVKISRYIGLAHQSNGIITKPPPELVASLTFISVVLFDAKVVPSLGCRVDAPASALSVAELTNLPSTASQARVLKILSFVLLAIHNRAQALSGAVESSVSTGPWNPVVLTPHVDQAKLIVDGARGHNDMARCLVVVLQAYFMLLRDDRRRAVVITEPLADLVADNPLVLHLHVVWSAVSAVRALMESAARSIAVERLTSAMEPLALRMGTACQDSVIGRELMSVFQRKDRNPCSTPVLTIRQNVHLADSSFLIRQKAQTSSLNVTAGDVLEPTTEDLLPIEPSPAPRRRAIPTLSSLRTHSADSAGRPDTGSAALSHSAQPGTTATSPGDALRVCSAPTPRTCALTRVPGLPYGFDSTAETSMINLDLSSYPSDYLDESPTEAVAASEDAPVTAITEDEEVDNGMSVVDRGEEAGGSGGGSAADGGSGGADAAAGREDETDDEMEGIDSKHIPGARDLLAHTVQASFNAKAPVTLDQVDRNLARLTVSQSSDGRPTLDQRINSLDLEAAANELLTKPSFIA